MLPDILYRESVVHRNGVLPLKLYESNYVEYHWHEEYEFLLPQSDGARCAVNGKQIILNRGDALMIRGGELHSIFLNKGESLTAIVVHPNFWCSEGCGDSLDHLQFPSLFSSDTEISKKAVSILTDIKELYYDRPLGYELMLKERFCAFFAMLIRNKAFIFVENENSPSHHDNIFLFEYVHQNLTGKLTLESLAQTTYYSKSYIIRLFKRHTGQTPVEYINRCRVELAKKMLTAERRSVLEIALECGFASDAYFIRIFKKYVGVTPGEWRCQANGLSQNRYITATRR